ncbi:hypothetical protein OIO90_002196 [Microbotryomycetes sp. JL221]|nr:hypothetical protein OIO90_002196 [Microbotryomycetes sp. JL221]
MGPTTTTTNDQDALTNTLKPITDIFLTIRIIKSFEYRTFKNLYLPHVDASKLKVGELRKLVQQEVKTASGFKPYRTIDLGKLACSKGIFKFQRLIELNLCFGKTTSDTLKLYTKAHGAKTQNLIINLDHDDWILQDDEATLASIGIENEAEISCFNRASYEAFKLDPKQSW